MWANIRLFGLMPLWSACTQAGPSVTRIHKHYFIKCTLSCPFIAPNMAVRGWGICGESFTLRTNENGRQYVTIADHELEKTHQGVNQKERGRDSRLYEQLNDPKCPVVSFKKYVSKLNPGCDACFFSGPKPQITVPSGMWIGKKKLSTMKKEISGKAQLSRADTNHCLCVTSARVLSKNDFTLNDIRSITGHRCVDGVLISVEGTSDAQRYKMELCMISVLQGTDLLFPTGFFWMFVELNVKVAFKDIEMICFGGLVWTHEYARTLWLVMQC